MEDDALHAVHRPDPREETLRDGLLRHDEGVGVVGDLRVVDDHLADADPRLRDRGRDPRENSRLRRARRDDLDRTPPHEGRDLPEVAHGAEALEELQRVRVLLDRLHGRGDDPTVHARRPSHRGVADLDWPREHPAVVDSQAVGDQHLGDLLLGGEPPEVRTQLLPHSPTNALISTSTFNAWSSDGAQLSTKCDEHNITSMNKKYI